MVVGTTAVTVVYKALSDAVFTLPEHQYILAELTHFPVIILKHSYSLQVRHVTLYKRVVLLSTRFDRIVLALIFEKLLFANGL